MVTPLDLSGQDLFDVFRKKFDAKQKFVKICVVQFEDMADLRSWFGPIAALHLALGIALLGLSAPEAWPEPTIIVNRQNSIQEDQLFKEGLEAYQKQKFDESIGKLKACLALAEKSSNKALQFNCLRVLSQASRQLRDFEQQLNYAKRAQTLGHELGALQETRALAILGSALLENGDAARADKAFGQGIDLIKNSAEEERDKRRDLLYQLLTGRGDARLKEGKLDEAREDFKKSLSLRRQLFPTGGLPVAKGFSDLGAVYWTLGQFNEALDLEKQALENISSYKDQPAARGTLASIYTNLGNCYLSQDKLDEAVAAHQQALEILKSNETSSEYANCLNSLGADYWSKGDFSKALEFHAKALTIVEGLKINEEISKCLNNVGADLYSKHSYKESLATYKKALDLLPDSPSLEAASLQDNIAEVYEAVAEYADAEKLVLNAMLAYEGAARSLLVDPTELAAFQQKYQKDIYARYARLLDRAGHPDQGLERLERGRARGLSSQIAVTNRSLKSILTPDEFRTLEAALAEANGSNKRVRLLELERSEKGSSRQVDVLLKDARSREREAEAKLTALRESLYLTNKDFKALLEPAYKSAEELDQIGKSRLDTLYIEYGPLKDEILRFTMHPTMGIKADRLPIKQSDFKTAVQNYSLAIESSDQDEQKLARQLYDDLLGGLEPKLDPNIKRIVIVGDGPMLDLPFAALIDKKGKRLIESYAISNAISISSLSWAQASRKSTKSLLAVVDPNGKGTEKQSSGSRAGFGPLPAARIEGTQVAAVFPDSFPLVGSSAREEEVKRIAGGYDILHFACHGYINPVNPLRSGLVLADVGDIEDQSTEDGQLEAREILGLQLSAQLAVLSACDSGRGAVQGGEGLIGLAWAFRAAGVPAIVASKWEVDDEATARIMVAFYKDLKAGKRKDDALRHAMLEEMDYPTQKGAKTRSGSVSSEGKPLKRSNAYYWAAFQLIGDGKPLTSSLTGRP